MTNETADNLKQFIAEYFPGVIARYSAELRGDIQRLDARVGNLEAGLERLDGRVGRLEAGLERMDGRMYRLENKVEQLDATVQQLDATVQRLDTTMQHMDRDFNRKLDNLSAAMAEALDTSNEASGKQLRNHERRITRLERRAA